METLHGYVLILLSTVLVNNVVLVRILGLCPFLGVSKKLDAAFGMGLATAFVLTIGCATSYLIDRIWLVPYHLEYLRIVLFIVVIAAIVQLTELVVKKLSPGLYQVLGIYLPLITTNCAVLGVPLLGISLQYGFVESLLFGFGNSVGFGLVMALFAGLREHIEGADVPLSFRGAPIALVTAGIMSLSFMGFSGLVRT